MKIKNLLTIALLGFTMVTATAQSNATEKVDQKNTETQRVSKQHELSGKATYYGNKYTKKRKTANGEWFDKNAYTAAHKTLSFGTIVRVTNKRNGKSVNVKITDRGQFGKGRIIDLSPIAAKDLEMLRDGVVPVIVEIISLPIKTKKKVIERNNHLTVKS